jgi:uncharacterized protein
MRKIDIFNHVMPLKFFERIGDYKDIGKRMREVPMLYDLDERFRVMDKFDDYQQVLCAGMPPIEALAGPKESPELARICNDGMAELCAQHPERFPTFIASLALNNPDSCIEEIHRSVKDLGARGVQVFSNVDGKPLDLPEFAPIFDAMAALDLPIFLHPARGANFPDYLTEKKSQYEMWWAFGWPYETSVAMARIVFSGLFDKLPGLTIITHHLGAMIPYFEGRVGPLWDQLGSRTADEDYRPILAAMTAKGKRPIDYFRLFHNDTAVGGAQSGIRCGLDFFGSERVLFGTDCPFDPEGGPMFIRDTIAALDGLSLSESERDAVYFGNALKLLKLVKN